MFQCIESLFMYALYLPPSGSSLFSQGHAAELHHDILLEVAEASVSSQVLLVMSMLGLLNYQINSMMLWDNDFDVSEYAAPLPVF